MSNRTAAIVVGGSGYLGRHLLRHLLEERAYERILVADLVPPVVQDESIEYLDVDIREPIDPAPFRSQLGDAEVTIYNLAAICRIPGFPDRDYFETNMIGAETVCSLADDLGCTNYVFTSSMSVYGASEELKTEQTLPMPDNPYGISKLVAEKIHLSWYAKGGGRRLQILRPGIIFGQDEQANFTRLAGAVSRGYFFYTGRRDTRKASIYVKDAARVHLHFAEVAPESFNLMNLVYPEAHRIDEIATAVARVLKKPAPRLLVPGWIMLTAARILTALFGFESGHFKFHPDRVRKLMVSTNVSGRGLQEYGFELKWSLDEALQDWYNDCGRKGLQ